MSIGLQGHSLLLVCIYRIMYHQLCRRIYVFVTSPTYAVVDLYEQYAHDLGNVLDRHAPLISRLTQKYSADWLSDNYHCAKSLRCQFKRTWHMAKKPLNISRLRHQIARFNALVNNDKSDYYSKLISDNSHGMHYIKP